MAEEERKVYEELLNEVNRIIQKKENKYKDLALDFNFFTIAGINRKEVINCRFLHELLNSKGLHNEGSFFLKKFVQNIIYKGGEIPQEIIKDIEGNSEVKKEEVIDDGRVDIVIHINDKTIPIEVKIDANDQSRQIKRYFENYKKNLFNDKVYYLTIDGDEPSDESRGELEIDKDIKCISWKGNILPWIDDCIKEMASDITKSKKNHVIETIRQFKQNIEIFCGIGDNEMEEEIKKLLMGKKEYYKSATKLKNGVSSASYEIMLKFFRKLQEEMEDNFKNNNIISECKPDYEESLKEYYLYNKKNHVHIYGLKLILKEISKMILEYVLNLKKVVNLVMAYAQ